MKLQAIDKRRIADLGHEQTKDIYSSESLTKRNKSSKIESSLFMCIEKVLVCLESSCVFEKFLSVEK